MSETSAPCIYEKAFAKTDKTDAILVVQGKKLHVDKALLSYHSDYFNTLFNSDFKEKSMSEIEIKDVKFKDFATLLSLVQNNPIKFEAENAEKLLELADRFQLPTVKRPIELICIKSTLDQSFKLKMADKYKLDALLNHAISLFQSTENFKRWEPYHAFKSTGNFKRWKNSPYYAGSRQVTNYELFNSLSDQTNAKLFHRLIEIYPF